MMGTRAAAPAALVALVVVAASVGTAVPARAQGAPPVVLSSTTVATGTTFTVTVAPDACGPVGGPVAIFVTYSPDAAPPPSLRPFGEVVFNGLGFPPGQFVVTVPAVPFLPAFGSIVVSCRGSSVTAPFTVVRGDPPTPTPAPSASVATCEADGTYTVHWQLAVPADGRALRGMVLGDGIEVGGTGATVPITTTDEGAGGTQPAAGVADQLGVPGTTQGTVILWASALILPYGADVPFAYLPLPVAVSIDLDGTCRAVPLPAAQPVVVSPHFTG